MVLMQDCCLSLFQNTRGIRLKLTWGMCVPDSCRSPDMEGFFGLGKFWHVWSSVQAVKTPVLLLFIFFITIIIVLFLLLLLPLRRHRFLFIILCLLLILRLLSSFTSPPSSSSLFFSSFFFCFLLLLLHRHPLLFFLLLLLLLFSFTSSPSSSSLFFSFCFVFCSIVFTILVYHQYYNYSFIFLLIFYEFVVVYFGSFFFIIIISFSFYHSSITFFLLQNLPQSSFHTCIYKRQFDLNLFRIHNPGRKQPLNRNFLRTFLPNLQTKFYPNITITWLEPIIYTTGNNEQQSIILSICARPVELMGSASRQVILGKTHTKKCLATIRDSSVDCFTYRCVFWRFCMTMWHKVMCIVKFWVPFY